MNKFNYNYGRIIFKLNIKLLLKKNIFLTAPNYIM